MSQIIRSCVSFLVLLVVLCSQTGDVSSEGIRLRVAVVEFEIKGEVDVADAGAIIPEMLVTALGEYDSFDLKERVLLKKVLNEQSLGLSGVIDAKSAVEIGKVYGIEGVITGSVVKWGKMTQVNARLINTAEGSVIRTGSIEATNIDDIPKQINHLADKLAGLAIVSAEAERPSKVNPTSLKTEQSFQISPIKPVSPETKAKKAAPIVMDSKEETDTYAGIWGLRTTETKYRSLSYSTLLLNQSGNKLTGLHDFNNGGKIAVEGTVDNGEMILHLTFSDDPSIELGLSLNGVDPIRPRDIVNTKTGMQHRKAIATARLQRNSEGQLVGTLQMWYVQIWPHNYPWAYTVSTAVVYDSNTPEAEKHFPRFPIKLIYLGQN